MYMSTLMIIVVTSEGLLGFICNFVLLISLIRLTKSARNIYLIPIFISCIEGLLLCLSIGTMNFTHVAREGMLICILLGPLVPWFSVSLRTYIFVGAFLIMSLMWTLTPATSILQYTSLSRPYWSLRKQLSVSFVFTVTCLILVMFSVPSMLPSPKLTAQMEVSMQKLFDMGVNSTIQVFGVSSKDSEYNEGSNMTIFAVLFALIPYPSAYSIIIIMMTLTRKYLLGFGGNLSTRTMQMQREFFTMQLLQSVLPLVTLVPPFLFVVFCFLMESNLDLASLPATAFAWCCPIVHASVQLRYVRQSLSRLTKGIGNNQNVTIFQLG